MLPTALTRHVRELLFKGYRILVWEDEKVTEMDGGDDCPMIQLYLVPLNCMLKNCYNDQFYVQHILS